MRRFLACFIPVAVLISFILIMIGGEYLKAPRGYDDDVNGCMIRLEQNIKSGDWDKARQERDKLELAWEKVVLRIQFSVEWDEIGYLSINISRIKGAIESKDKAAALMEILEAHEHWNELDK